jgi:hypothetical protein
VVNYPSEFCSKLGKIRLDELQAVARYVKVSGALSAARSFCLFDWPLVERARGLVMRSSLRQRVDKLGFQPRESRGAMDQRPHAPQATTEAVRSVTWSFLHVGTMRRPDPPRTNNGANQFAGLPAEFSA